MTKRDKQRAHDFVDAFEAEIVERGRRAIASQTAERIRQAGLPLEAAPTAWRRGQAIWGCFLLRYPEAMKHERTMGRVLGRLAPFIDRRVWDSDMELARLVVAIYMAVEEEQG